jgi:acetyl-CoA carboxylase/biotin carboxylase 1
MLLSGDTVIDVGSACSRIFDSIEEFVSFSGGHSSFKKVLIANNGIAAVKGIRSIRRWAYEVFENERAIKLVVMTTPEDLKSNSEYIRLADEFIQVEGGNNYNNFANVSLIIDVVERTRCEVCHIIA